MGKETVDNINKRSFQRLNIKLDVKVTFDINEEKQDLKLKSRNLSQQGICLEAAQDQAETLDIISNTNNFESLPFDMEIVLPPENTCINIHGKACWYDIGREKEHFYYLIGVVFIDPGQKELKLLKNFLKNTVKTKVF
jgi:hypothetical protein